MARPIASICCSPPLSVPAAWSSRSASRGYVLETGNIVLAGTAAELRENPEVQKAYLGIE